MKAVFLDRDGVLLDNSEHYYIFRPEQVKWVNEVPQNLKQIAEKGYQLFIVTNQGGVAKGEYTMQKVDAIHRFMLDFLKQYQVEINEIAVCPHHPEVEKCMCRKPSPLMIERLIAKHKIDPSSSFFIGDSVTDMQAAKAAGLQEILIPANQSMKAFLNVL